MKNRLTPLSIPKPVKGGVIDWIHRLLLLLLNVLMLVSIFAWPLVVIILLSAHNAPNWGGGLFSSLLVVQIMSYPAPVVVGAVGALWTRGRSPRKLYMWTLVTLVAPAGLAISINIYPILCGGIGRC